MGPFKSFRMIDLFSCCMYVSNPNESKYRRIHLPEPKVHSEILPHRLHQIQLSQTTASKADLHGKFLVCRNSRIRNMQCLLVLSLITPTISDRYPHIT